MDTIALLKVVSDYLGTPGHEGVHELINNLGTIGASATLSSVRLAVCNRFAEFEELEGAEYASVAKTYHETLEAVGALEAKLLAVAGGKDSR